MSIFDGIQDVMMGTVNAVFSDIASWTPSVPPALPGQHLPPGVEQTAKVLFREPSTEIELAGIQYQPNTFILEYYTPDFINLKTRVDQGKKETIICKGNEYFVKAVTAIADGKTFRAVLQYKGPVS